MTVEDFLQRPEGVRKSGQRWMARCPAHADRSPSLSVREGEDGRILLHCFAGCSVEAICEAIGCHLCDLFPDTPTPRGQGKPSRPSKIDRVALAFRFELVALDRRLRADRVLKAAKGCCIDKMADKDFDRLMNVVGRAYDDQELAEFLETVADDLRVRAYKKTVAFDAA